MAAGGPVRRWLVNAVRRRVWFVERTFDALRRYVASWTGTDRPRSVAAFDGWTNGTTLRCGGRVLATPPAGPVRADDSAWTNLRRAWFAWNSREVSGVRVRLTLPTPGRPNDAAPFVAEAVSDEEGYVFFDVAVDPPPPPGPHAATLDLPDHPDVRAGLTVFAADDADGPGLISDIDDTVLQSEVTRPLRMLRLLIFGNAETRAAVEGVTELYQSFVRGRSGESNNPVFYVSSSPWNLEPMLAAFMRRVGLPAGPMMLRDLGIGRDAESGLNHGHKEVKIRRILEQYPSMRFVLLGDAGQEDAAIYSRICDDFGDQVIVAYIRQVGSMPSDRVVHAVAHAQDRGTPVLLLPGTKSIVADALSRSLIATETAVAAAEAVEDSDESVLVRAKSAVDPDDVPVTGDEPLPASATASS